MKHKTIIFLVLFTLSLSVFSAEQLPGKPGEKAPVVKLVTPFDKTISTGRYKNKYYAFIFEGRDGARQNFHVRKRMVSFISMLSKEKRKQIAFFKVADVSAYRLLKTIVLYNIKKEQKKFTFPLYSDFSGDMRGKFGFNKETSNFALVDKNNVIKYRIRGTVSQEKLDEICSYLISEFDVPYVKAPIDISAAYGSAAYRR